jgi:hypothetical protein
VTENIKEQSTLLSLPFVDPTHQLNEKEIINMLQELDSNEDSSLSSSDESENIEKLHTPKDQKAKMRAPLVNIQIAVSNLSRSVTPVAERCGLSIRYQLLVTSSLIVNGRGSTEEFPSSVGTIHHDRKLARCQLSKQIYKWMNLKKPDFPVLHYDAKLINFLSHGKEERLAILISGSSSG